MDYYLVNTRDGLAYYLIYSDGLAYYLIYSKYSDGKVTDCDGKLTYVIPSRHDVPANMTFAHP